MKPNFLLIAAIAACSSAGFIAGRMSFASSESHRPENTASKPTGSRLGPRARVGPEHNQRGNTGPPATGASIAQMHMERSHTAPSDPSISLQANMQAILSNPSPIERAEAWLRFVQELDPAKMEEAVANFRDSGLGAGMTGKNLSEYCMLLNAWANHDPYAALDYAQNNTSTALAEQTILATWATTDPDAAIRWAEENHDGDEANPWMVGVIRGIAASDPAYATELMKVMPPSKHRYDALESISSQYLDRGPEAARNWAMGISDEGLRSGAVAKIADSLAANDPRGTADWLLSNPVQASINAMDDVMEHMTLADSRDAINYMESISDPAFKRYALEGIANELSAIDPHATLAMINAHPDLIYDDIVRELIWGARTSEPVLAANAIARIENQFIRDRTYKRFIGRWVQTDLEGARAWVNQNELPTEISQEVRKMIETGVGLGPFEYPGP